VWRFWQGTKRSRFGRVVWFERSSFSFQNIFMILNILLILGGFICLIATGVFVFELRHAPLGAEAEHGFSVLENSCPMRTGNYRPAKDAGYTSPTTSTPFPVL
jgi:hypothetical protein